MQGPLLLSLIQYALGLRRAHVHLQPKPVQILYSNGYSKFSTTENFVDMDINKYTLGFDQFSERAAV